MRGGMNEPAVVRSVKNIKREVKGADEYSLSCSIPEEVSTSTECIGNSGLSDDGAYTALMTQALTPSI